MTEYSTSAIVLVKKTAGESDARAALYTEELGKIDVIAKGVKKSLLNYPII
jgi:recombinational DNA repair protein (RecF pathway)